MKIRSKTIIFFLFVIVAFQAIIQSCNVDKCKALVCGNGSYCQLGTCVCPIGYEGTNCEAKMRDKFLGNWVVFEKGSRSLTAQYPVSIDTIGTNTLTQVRILNFNDSFRSPVYATVQGYNITIPTQQMEKKITFGNGYAYATAGVNYNQYNIINMVYEVIDSATGLINDYGYDSLVDGSRQSTWNKQ